MFSKPIPVLKLIETTQNRFKYVPPLSQVNHQKGTNNEKEKASTDNTTHNSSSVVSFILTGPEVSLRSLP